MLRVTSMVLVMPFTFHTIGFERAIALPLRTGQIIATLADPIRKVREAYLPNKEGKGSLPTE